MSAPSPSRRAGAGTGTPVGGRAVRLSPFYRDLASPLPHHRTISRLTPSSLTLGSPASPPPPPPLFTLDDRSASSDHAAGDADVLLPASPASKSPSPFSSPSSSMRVRSFGRGSPVEGVVEERTPEVFPASSPSAPPDEAMVTPVKTLDAGRAIVPVKMPSTKRASDVVTDHEEWVTVFGFHLGDTNIVLREFEKFGTILKHFSGPIGANWMHLLYQHAYDARKALEKNGTQLTGNLIVGVKPVDTVQSQLLNEKLNSTINRAFMVSLPTTVASSSTNSTYFEGPSRPYLPKANRNVASSNGPRAVGSIASPAGSVFSRALDLVFGI